MSDHVAFVGEEPQPLPEGLWGIDGMETCCQWDDRDELIENWLTGVTVFPFSLELRECVPIQAVELDDPDPDFWPCRVTGVTRTINVEDWVREHRPEWTED